MLLESIKKPNDIKKIDPKDYDKLAEEIRQFLIHSISKTGGHLGSNLGVVELTMALHLALDLPKDKIVWDVGHQSYTHKLLTGRKEGFDNLRKYGGMSGFPKRCESDCFRNRGPFAAVDPEWKRVLLSVRLSFKSRIPDHLFRQGIRNFR